MSNALRSALLDLAWAPNLEHLRAEYRMHETRQYSVAEHETLAVVFNQLVHVFQIEKQPSSPAAAAAQRGCRGRRPAGGDAAHEQHRQR